MQYMKKKCLMNNEIENIILKIRSNELHGVNVTVPYKNTVVEYGHFNKRGK